MKLLLSVAVSISLLGLLIRFSLSATEQVVWSSLVAILLSFSATYVLLYLGASLVRTLLQSLRYRLLLRATEPSVLSLFHIYLVTLTRNMFVDMLPARLGELSYIAMLNRGYRISGESCVSSLAISFVFDLIALGVLLAGLMLVQLLGGNLQTWMAGVLIVLLMVIGGFLMMLFPLFSAVNKLIAGVGWLQKGIWKKGTHLLVRIEQALQNTRRAGINGQVLVLSVGVRLAKYFGLYCLFVGVVIAAYPEMTTAIAVVLPALVSAEAGASLPVPALMGFGTYEAGGTLALVALGVKSSTSLIVMLALHVISQIVDYVLGAIGLILFIFKSQVKTITSVVAHRISWKKVIPLIGLAGMALLFLVWEMRVVNKRGSLQFPDRGQAVVPASAEDSRILNQLNGYLVWSSNRSGNHDIYLRSFPDGNTRRLTTHPHTEYFPRISPDGRRIVFARSHEPWVSQRNVYAWDVWLFDLKTGKEWRLAKNGNVPTWSKDGKKVYFQRNGNQVVELDLKSSKETVIYQSGVNVQVKPKTELQTPNLSSDGRLAVTFRKTMRATAVVGQKGEVKKIGKGCQLSWAPGDRFLFKIDDNAVHKVNPKTLGAELWFDAPEPYSHEYFPMVANTADVLVYGASAEGHEHDSADYEIFLWVIGQPVDKTVRITFHTGNDCWPDIYLKRKLQR